MPPSIYIIAFHKYFKREHYNCFLILICYNVRDEGINIILESGESFL